MFDLIRFYEEEASKHTAIADAFQSKADALKAKAEYTEVQAEPVDEDIPSEEQADNGDENLKEAQEANKAMLKEHPDAFNPTSVPEEKKPISMDDLKTKTAKAARTYKAEILEELSRLEVRKVSELTGDRIEAFNTFLDGLTGGGEDA